MAATQRATITLTDDQRTDLQIIAQRAPGRGQAFQRLITIADMSHADVAHAIGRSRGTISSWCTESRWPPDDDIRRALVAIGIDRKQLLDTWGVLLATDVAPREDLTRLAQSIKVALDFESDKLERHLIIFRGLGEEILIKQGFKAREDTRAAEFFFNKWEKAEEEKQKRSLGSSRNVTPAQAMAASGDVYENAPISDSGTPGAQDGSPDTPTSSDLPTDNGA